MPPPDLEQLKELILTKTPEARQELFRKNILLVCGKKGTGKKSLLQAIFGDRSKSNRENLDDLSENINDRLSVIKIDPEEDDFSEILRTVIPSHFADPLQQKQWESQSIIVWYLLDSTTATDATIDSVELQSLQNLAEKLPFVVVLTKRDLIRPAQLESLFDLMERLQIPPEKVVATSDISNSAIGCKELVEFSARQLIGNCQNTFLTSQQIDVELQVQAVKEKTALANTIIATATATAGGIGLIPIPLSDAALLLPTQMSMIGALAVLYDMDNELIGNLALPFVAQCAGIVTAASLTKLIPGLGSLINAGVATTLTGAMGLFMRNNFEEMAIKKIHREPVPNFGIDFEQFRKFYQEYIKL